MSYHTLVYNASAAAAGATNVDFAAASDAIITQRNSHYTFTDDFKLLAAALVGASVTRGRYQSPQWNAIAEYTIFNANRSLQPPSNPQYDYYREYMPFIPKNEEFQVQASNNLGAATEIENCILHVAPSDWRMQLPPSKLLVLARATLTLTPTLNAWSGGQVISFSQSLRGGVYAMVGTVVQGSNIVAYRWLFPRGRPYQGRILRPGGLSQNAVGDVINQQIDPWVIGLGVQGYFHTFELPQLEVFGTAASSTTFQIFMWLAFLGEELSLLNAALSGALG